MPYTNAWSNITPAGGDLAGNPGANKVSAAIRRLKLDIQERMSSVVVDWFADPVVFPTKINAFGFAKFYPFFGPNTPSVVKAMLVLDVQATTDGLGKVTLNLAILAEVWPIIPNFIGFPPAMFWDNTSGVVVCGFLGGTTATTITITVEGVNGGLVIGHSITGRVILLFSATP